MKLVVVSVRLTTPKKRLLLGPLALHTHIEAIVNYGSVQRDRAVALGVPVEKVHVLHQPVDELFWQPADRSESDLICAVGWEARDYKTLLAAVDGLPARVEIAVGSSVASARRGSSSDLAGRLGAIVHRQLPPRALRDLYSRARIVVVPLENVDYDAGVTVVTEALAMGKPVIVTRTRGQVDVIREGRHGLAVPPDDPSALRTAIESLLADAGECDRMGRAGRELICEQHSLDRYIASLRETIVEIASPT